MPTSVGPNTKGEENLVFGYDQGYFPNGWTLTQLFPNSEFVEGGTAPTGHDCYTSGNYLGPITASIMQGGTYRFTGGDFSNYYGTHPEWRGWNSGTTGGTGGNWIRHYILPSTFDSTTDYIVDMRVRFVYVSKTGNGSTNPVMYVGRAYNVYRSISYSEIGDTFKNVRFKFNGAQGTDHGSSNTAFVIGGSSADAMIELDYLRVYRIEKSTGLKDLTGNSTIDLTNVSFDSNAQMTFDGTNDEISIANIGANLQNFGITFEMVWKQGSIHTSSTFGEIISPLQLGIRDLGLGPTLYFQLRSSTIALRWQRAANDSVISPTTSQETGVYNLFTGVLTNTGVSLYKNGELVGTTSHSKTFQTWYNNTVEIGTNAYNTAFDGDIPLTKIYSRALTASEVASNYKAIKGRFNI